MFDIVRVRARNPIRRSVANGLDRTCEHILGAPLEHLSMGMSGDFEVAIEEGSTLIRVGTALFGPRSKAPKQTGVKSEIH